MIQYKGFLTKSWLPKFLSYKNLLWSQTVKYVEILSMEGK